MIDVAAHSGRNGCGVVAPFHSTFDPLGARRSPLGLLVTGNVGRETIREAMHAGDVTAPRSILHGSPYPLSALVRLIQPLRCGFVP